MKKPKIEVNEIGAMGPDGIELKIGDDITLYCRKWAEAQIIEEMIDALILAYKECQNEGAESSIEYEQALIKALKKAGVQL